MILIGLLFGGLFLATLILPWVCLIYIYSLRKQINQLRDQVSWLITQTRKKGAKTPGPWESLSQPSVPEKKETPEAFETPLAVAEPMVKSPPKKTIPPKETSLGFEQKYLASLPVWIGGIALALSGAFLVKYSIEMGFLSPSVRIIIGILFGLILLFAGHWIHNKPHIANGTRISQALSGAGIADLYACLFAATSFYNLIPPVVGFIGMGLVTAIAVILSLTQGAPIAMLGMIGGFLTPALIESKEPSAPLLFIYLYFLLAGLFVVISKKNWWFIAIPVVLGAFIWVFGWVAATSYSPNDSLCLGLFLIAMSTTIVFFSKKAMEDNVNNTSKAFQLLPYLNYLSLGGAILLMSVIAAKSNFGVTEWGLFGSLSAGGMVLSYFNPQLYGFIPWASVFMNVIMLLGWKESDPSQLAVTILAFALLYTVGAYWLMWQTRNARPWALLSALSSLIYYVIGYAKFNNWFEITFKSTDPHFWGVLAFGLFAVMIGVIVQILNRFQGEDDTKQYLLTIYTLTAAAFLSIGLTLELNKEFLTIALATEVLAVSWINGHVHIKSLCFIAGLFATFFGILIIPQVFIQIFILSNNVWGGSINGHFNEFYFYTPELATAWESWFPTINWSLLHLGLPSVMFGLSSFLLHQQKNGRLVKAFEMAAIGLITVMTYYLTRHIFHINENLLLAQSTFMERGMVTNLFFLYALGCLWAGRRFDRQAILLSGEILLCLSLLRILFFDLLFDNPWETKQDVGSWPIVNGLTLSFGLPILWLFFATKELAQSQKQQYIPYINACSLVLLFCFVSFNVSQIYHGQYLYKGSMSNAEIYTYSVVWLLIGIVLLFFGTLKKNKTLRIASLSFMILTIGKVFLYDASELTGLLRVFSFLGLGVSLLGLSWFYTRFVFKPTA